MSTQAQKIPVRVYDAKKQIILAAPLPGLEPENISVTLTGNKVSIQGEERGPGQHRRDVIMDEWTIGPYYREVTLPQPVNGNLTNATYGNGVLVLSMPKRSGIAVASGASFRLHPVDAMHGERIGHTGKDIHPQAEAKHDKKHQAEKRGEAKISSR
ncbi:MAG TPA: Hsp20/alpha crystallin family protein [Candidatus Binatia bacterium]|nr:Hsp20/alpha crystallin family protein [Candidatus Binatia bacterium]